MLSLMMVPISGHHERAGQPRACAGDAELRSGISCGKRERHEQVERAAGQSASATPRLPAIARIDCVRLGSVDAPILSSGHDNVARARFLEPSGLIGRATGSDGSRLHEQPIVSTSGGCIAPSEKKKKKRACACVQRAPAFRRAPQLTCRSIVLARRVVSAARTRIFRRFTSEVVSFDARRDFAGHLVQTV